MTKQQHSNRVTIGSSDKKRVELDFYTTDKKDFERFLNALNRDGFSLKDTIWECSAGLGDLMEVLSERGHSVVGTDIHIRDNCRVDIKQQDFLSTLLTENIPSEYETILTNPPFNIVGKFIKRGLELLKNGQHLILMSRIQLLEGKERYKIFLDNPMKYVYVYSTRANCHTNGEKTTTSGAVCFSWFIWEKGFNGEAVIRFIP